MRAIAFALHHATLTALSASALSAAAGVAAIARLVSLVGRHPSTLELVFVSGAAALTAVGVGLLAFARLVRRYQVGCRASNALFAFSWLMCVPGVIAGNVGVFRRAWRRWQTHRWALSFLVLPRRWWPGGGCTCTTKPLDLMQPLGPWALLWVAKRQTARTPTPQDITADNGFRVHRARAEGSRIVGRSRSASSDRDG